MENPLERGTHAKKHKTQGREGEEESGKQMEKQCSTSLRYLSEILHGIIHNPKQILERLDNNVFRLSLGLVLAPA